MLRSKVLLNCFKLMLLTLVITFAFPVYAVDRDEFRRVIFQDGADNEVLIQYGNTGSANVIEVFDGTVAGGTLIYRLGLTGTIAQIEAVHAIYLNWTDDGGVGSGDAIFGMTTIPGDPPTPPANMGKYYVKGSAGSERPYWIDSSGNVFDILIGGGGGTGAPAGATYIVQIANGSLSSEQALNQLSDGLLKHTSGVVAQAVAGTDYLTEIVQDTTPQFGGAVTGVVDFGGATSTEIANSSDVSANIGDGMISWDNVTKTLYIGDGVNLVPIGGGSETLNELHINFVVPSTAFSEFSAIDIEIDESAMVATSGVHAINVAAVGGSAGEVTALGTFTGVAPVHQHIGTFQSVDQTTPDAFAGEIPSGGSWSDGLDGYTLFEANSDEIYIGAVAKFSELEVMLSTPCSKNETLTWEYFNTDTSWDAFTPIDGTEGFQQSGLVVWMSDNLTGWGNTGDPGGGDTATGYWIRARRVRAGSATDPIATTIKTLEPVEYEWDALGNVAVKSVAAADDNILMVPLEYATITLAEAAAVAGDTIDIAPGTYNEAVTVDVNNIVICGNAVSTIINGGTTGTALNITASGIQVRNLRAQTTAAGGNAYDAVAISGNNITLDSVSVNASDRYGYNITGDNVRLFGCGSAVTDQQNVFLSGADHFDLDGCIFEGTAGADETILAATSDFGRIVGCKIEDGTNEGIELAATCDEVVVSGNWLATFRVNDAGANSRVSTSYVDRGVAGAVDFAVGDLTTNGLPQDLDFSSIVPEGATNVVLMVIMQSGGAGNFIIFRKQGSGTELNQGVVRTQAANIKNDGQLTVALNAGRVIEYIAANIVWTSIDITVVGWHF